MSDLISRSDSYMNDLIRRKDALALFPTNDCSDKMVGLYERVLDIPTAYDIEKVVAELACNSRFIDDINEHNIKCISCVIGQKTAIDIVKAGGVVELSEMQL